MRLRECVHVLDDVGCVMVLFGRLCGECAMLFVVLFCVVLWIVGVALCLALLRSRIRWVGGASCAVLSSCL